ncbi:hypothetical protein LTR84_002656 [Exophiala bonariae]|uniref:Uncharacterized protein n=1 Tax=Exophiala bonariae TaxID=1690606 RepID=A0AAV9N8I0_9EURO|nr:hypothetical protein LTR84_002656 [Exophiala bonariae]
MSSVVLGVEKLPDPVAPSSDQYSPDHGHGVAIETMPTKSVSIDPGEATDPEASVGATSIDSGAAKFQKHTGNSQILPYEENGNHGPYRVAKQRVGSFTESDNSDDTGILLFKGRRKLI